MTPAVNAVAAYLRENVAYMEDVIHNHPERAADFAESILEAAALAASEPPSDAEPLDVDYEPHAPGDSHDYGRLVCVICGQYGQITLSIEPQRVARLTDTAPETAQQIFDQHGEPTDD